MEGPLNHSYVIKKNIGKFKKRKPEENNIQKEAKERVS